MATVTPPFSGEQETAASFLANQIPMKGKGWDCLIAGLAAGEQVAMDNAPLVQRQMFLSTASEVWLDRRAAAVGVERPLGVGMADEPFREYAVQVSSSQQTIVAFLEMLHVFYGREAVQASAQALDEPYALNDGDTLALTFDGITSITTTFLVQDFSNISSARAVEVASVLNREFSFRGLTALALVETNPLSTVSRVTIYSGTLGARGSLQVASGAAQAALGLPTTLQRLLGRPRSSYVLSRGKGEVEVFFPATTKVVSRDLTSACYLTTLPPTVYGQGLYNLGVYSMVSTVEGVGPYLFEGVDKGLALTETVTQTTNALLASNQYRTVEVTSTADFPDEEGWLVFGYGYSYQTEPVHYLGKAGATTLLIDMGFTFARTVPAGAMVNMLVDENPPMHRPGLEGCFYLTDSPAGRVAAQDAIDSIAAAGYTVHKTVLYPSDVGLGNAGHPKHGVQDISDIVQGFAGSDVDGEVAAARSE